MGRCSQLERWWTPWWMVLNLSRWSLRVCRRMGKPSRVRAQAFQLQQFFLFWQEWKERFRWRQERKERRKLIDKQQQQW